MKKANFVTEITVVDPDTNGDVNIAIYKHQNGGMFGIDASYILENFEDDEDIQIPDIFATSYHHVMLID